MKTAIETHADILENLRELACNDAMLQYTLERLALQTPANRKRVLDALRPGKPGRPNRQAAHLPFFREVERTIQMYRPQFEKELERQVSENEIIVWLIKRGNFPAYKDFSEFGKSFKQAIKRTQDGLADYRKGIRASLKPL